MNDGKIILLNGASSSGKSSLASAVQDVLDEPFWRLSIDHFIAADLLPTRRIRNGEFPWSSLRPGFIAGFHQCIPALVNAGNNVVLEYVAETREAVGHLLGNLKGLDVFVVGVHCALSELERREAARGDRRAGSARVDFETTHKLMCYDWEVDMTSTPPKDAAILLKAAWLSRSDAGVHHSADTSTV